MEHPDTNTMLRMVVNEASHTHNKEKLYEYDNGKDSVGEGEYGVVLKAKNLKTGEIVAIKRHRMKDQNIYGLMVPTLRECQILQQLDHKNIIKVKDFFMSNWYNSFPTLNMVMEYCDYNFYQFLRRKVKFTMEEMKCFMYQVFEGLAYLHKKKIFHRDIKDANILLTKDGVVKICDFGLARYFKKDDFSTPYSTDRVTLNYRPPEIILENPNYDASIDIWSAGCVFMNQFRQTMFLCGKTDKDVLKCIVTYLGTPTGSDLEYLKGSKAFTHYFSENQHTDLISIRRSSPRRLSSLLGNASRELIDLLNKIFQYNPKNRISAEDALKHPFFRDVNMNALREFIFLFNIMFSKFLTVISLSDN